MRAEGDAGLLELGPVPGVDEVEAEPPVRDVLDLQRHLRQHHGVVEIGLDGGEDLDAAGERREGRRGGPGLDLVPVRQVRVDRVLRDEGRVITQGLGLQHRVAIVRPGGVERLGRVLPRGARSVNRRPDADAERMGHLITFILLI